MSSRAIVPPGHDFGDDQHNEFAIAELKARVKELEATIERLQVQADEAKRVLRPIRKQLEPLFNALQMVFGQLDAAGVEPSVVVVASPSAPQSNTKWESWKKALPGKPAEFIDLLLVHGEMSTAQLMAAAKCAKQTVYDTAFKMKRSGILVQNGRKYRLKEL